MDISAFKALCEMQGVTCTVERGGSLVRIGNGTVRIPIGHGLPFGVIGDGPSKTAVAMAASVLFSQPKPAYEPAPF